MPAPSDDAEDDQGDARRRRARAGGASRRRPRHAGRGGARGAAGSARARAGRARSGPRPPRPRSARGARRSRRRRRGRRRARTPARAARASARALVLDELLARVGRQRQEGPAARAAAQRSGHSAKTSAGTPISDRDDQRRRSSRLALQLAADPLAHGGVHAASAGARPRRRVQRRTRTATLARPDHDGRRAARARRRA